MRLLLVEDDNLLGDGLYVGLKQADYTVDWVTDGEAANHALINEDFDLVVLDLGLPIISGIEVLQALRKRNDKTPVLILTAMDSVENRILGLDSGADDYLIKPFDLEELCARLRALARRYAGRSDPILTHGTLELNPAAHTVTKDNKSIALSSREFVLLLYLMENIGRVSSRTRLEETLYGWDGEIESNSLEVFIHHLRKKIGNDTIKTVRGVGYMIEKITC
ncbi:Two-component system response regulator QseB [hydrothermal vent metagenome]|uniref:Two-component system response regulator QseB n=1 Tax=hydrothermal vent metagenome TaxID=652676 RepID=A0A3B1A8T7_9ZZZZ